MKGIFINSSGRVKYAEEIVAGHKRIETRSRNMLRSLVGERVAIVRTGRGRPMIIGYATITAGIFCTKELYETVREFTLVPKGSKYDVTDKGKWLYQLDEAEECEPYPLPADAVRHGLSWCEFEMEGTANG